MQVTAVQTGAPKLTQTAVWALRGSILDYTNQPLGAGYAVTPMNDELSALHSFLAFLQGEGRAVLE